MTGMAASPAVVGRVRERATLWGLFLLRFDWGSRDGSELVSKMVWRVKLVTELEPGLTTEGEVARPERDAGARLGRPRAPPRGGQVAHSCAPGGDGPSAGNRPRRASPLVRGLRGRFGKQLVADFADEQGHRAEVRRNAVYAGETQVPLLGRGEAGPWVGEVDAAVGFDYDVIRPVQLPSLETVRDHGETAVEFLPRDPTGIMLAGEQTALKITG
jgi:hypothetical protein